MENLHTSGLSKTFFQLSVLQTDIEVDIIDPDTASGKTDSYALQNF